MFFLLTVLFFFFKFSLTTINNCARLSINGKNTSKEKTRIWLSVDGLTVNLIPEYLIALSRFLRLWSKSELSFKNQVRFYIITNQMALLIIIQSIEKEIVVKQLCISMVMWLKKEILLHQPWTKTLLFQVLARLVFYSTLWNWKRKEYK